MNLIIMMKWRKRFIYIDKNKCKEIGLRDVVKFLLCVWLLKKKLWLDVIYVVFFLDIKEICIKCSFGYWVIRIFWKLFSVD